MRFDSKSHTDTHTHSDEEDDEPLLLPVRSSVQQQQPQEVVNLTPRLLIATGGSHLCAALMLKHLQLESSFDH